MKILHTYFDDKLVTNGWGQFANLSAIVQKLCACRQHTLFYTGLLQLLVFLVCYDDEDFDEIGEGK